MPMMTTEALISALRALPPDTTTTREERACALEIKRAGLQALRDRLDACPEPKPSRDELRHQIIRLTKQISNLRASR